MKAGKALIVAGALMASAVLLVACNEEQGGVFLQKKSAYLSKADQPLTEKQLGELRARTMLQAGDNMPQSSNAPKTGEPDVRPPGAKMGGG